MSGTPLTTVEERLNELTRERDKLQARLACIDGMLPAFKTVLEACAEASPLSQNGPIDADNRTRVSLEEALISIAESQSGELNSYNTRPMLVDSGLLRGEPRSISTQLYEALSASDRFEAMETKGRWRLIPESHGEADRELAPLESVLS